MNFINSKFGIGEKFAQLCSRITLTRLTQCVCVCETEVCNYHVLDTCMKFYTQRKKLTDRQQFDAFCYAKRGKATIVCFYFFPFLLWVNFSFSFSFFCDFFCDALCILNSWSYPRIVPPFRICFSTGANSLSLSLSSVRWCNLCDFDDIFNCIKVSQKGAQHT